MIRAVVAARSLRVLPITPEIADLSGRVDLHGDPADRLISATAIHHDALLVTSDHRLRWAASVRTLW